MQARTRTPSDGGATYTISVAHSVLDENEMANAILKSPVTRSVRAPPCIWMEN